MHAATGLLALVPDSPGRAHLLRRVMCHVTFVCATGGRKSVLGNLAVQTYVDLGPGLPLRTSPVAEPDTEERVCSRVFRASWSTAQQPGR